MLQISKRIGFDFTDNGAKRALLVQGRSILEKISLFSHDLFFAETMGLSFVPTPETLRLYLEQVAGNYF